MRTSGLCLTLALAVGMLATACTTVDDVAESEEDLTSATARARTLTFAGVVYVEPSASAATILATVRKQTQSAFGALRTANVGVNSRELKDVDPKTFQKSNVTVIDTKAPTAPGKPMLRVAYKFTDNALVPVPMAKRSSLGLGLLCGNYSQQVSRITKECTDGGHEALEFQGEIWYVFNPSLSPCRKAMLAEQALIAADRAKLKDAKTQVPKSDVDRLYLPATVSLTGDKTNKGLSFPEYDRLYAGGVQKDKIVIGMVSGMMADWAQGEKHDTVDDDGYPMWFEGLREILKVRKFTVVKTDPPIDLTTVTAAGVTLKDLKFEQFIGWQLDGYAFPKGFETLEKKKLLKVAVANMLARRWITFETVVNVKIGTAAVKKVTIQVNTYFGAEGGSEPHKRAIKTSDVFIYNGHSYIGYGPLDPNNFSAADFPPSYQILFINGCVSYNYYEKDYFPLKKGGSENLELVTNGLESWVNGSGPAMGRFIATLINGKQASYMDLLKAAQFTGYGYAWGQDALRVVDGEVDNKYTPTKKKIVVTQ